MKRIIASLLVLLTLISIPSLSAADTASLALQADSAYNREDYRAAIDLYRAAIAADGPSTVVYYNPGNAYYRNDNIGKAVVAYERALRIDPTNDQARQNLSFVRSRIQDRPEDDSTFLANLHRSIRNSMHANGWAVAALVIFALLLGAVALYIFAPGVTLRKTGFFGGVVLVFVFIYALVLARDSAAHARSHESAVVVVPMTQLSSVPRAAASGDNRVVPIHEGTTVEIVDSVATPDDPASPMWYFVEINNSTRAWLRSADVERI